MATTHNATGFAQFLGTNAPYGSGSFGIVKLHCDMAKIAAELAATVDGSAADVLQVWDVPVGTVVLQALLDVTQAEGAAATVTIGDATSAAGFLAATSINSVAKTGTIITDAFGATGGKMYAATDTIDLVFATAADIDYAIFDVYLYCLFNEAVQ